jgi:hypothetical protein
MQEHFGQVQVPAPPRPCFKQVGLGPARVRSGSGAEILCVFGTSGSMRIAALELRSQACQNLTIAIAQQDFNPSGLLLISPAECVCHRLSEPVPAETGSCSRPFRHVRKSLYRRSRAAASGRGQTPCAPVNSSNACCSSACWALRASRTSVGLKRFQPSAC